MVIIEASSLLGMYGVTRKPQNLVIKNFNETSDLQDSVQGAVPFPHFLKKKLRNVNAQKKNI